MSSADVTVTFHIPDLDNMPGTIPELVERLSAVAAEFGAGVANPVRVPVEKRLVQVGERLTADDMDTLPAGSVLRDKTGVLMRKDGAGHWANDTGTTSVVEAEPFAEFWMPVLVSTPTTNTEEQTR